MDLDDADGDNERQSPLLPPDDRLWRHPSEVTTHGFPFAEAPGTSSSPRVWAVAALAAVVSALLTVGVVAVTGGLAERVETIPAVERVALPFGSMSTALAATVPGENEISRRLRPTIVALRVERQTGGRVASGVMFRSDGHLLTNHDVVDGASLITAVMADGRQAMGRLVASDPVTGIAVVKVDDWQSVPTAAMGSAAGLHVGQDVMVMGADSAVSTGRVRGVGHQLERDGAPALVDMIQTDAPIAAAASGGALADASGAVVGIMWAVAKSTTSQGGENETETTMSGFATPIDDARSVAEQLLATGTVARAWIGIEGADLDPARAARMGLVGGAVVRQVRDASPAGDAGLVADDVITAVDAAPVRSMAALRILLRAHRPGDVVTLAVSGVTGSRNVRVKTAERPSPR